VTSAETERGRKWAESRIKALTGGDPVTARFMRQDFFTYTPSFKLAVVGNYKPRLVSVDAAMRRRLQLIPFEAKFDGAGVVRDMPEVLRLEWPGILRWLLNGCLRWQKQGGLGLPERVRTATEQYFTDQDVVGAWRAQCCESGPDYWASPSALYRSWGEFARAAEHPVGSQSSFNEQLESAGFRQSREHSRGRHWKGIRLRSIGDSDAP
jgi:putative DNA primase/helicase